MYRLLNLLSSIIYVAPAALLAISVHEMAHGLVSDRLGDPTPRMDGRLSLNPLHHLDLWGTLCLIVFHFGWAKPVRVNAAYYRDKRMGMILVSLAGPGSNFLLAFVSMFLFGLTQYKELNFLGIWSLPLFLYYLTMLNIGLGLFNLIPIPPLDGSNVLMEIFPQVKSFFWRIRRYSSLILIFLIASDFLSRPLAILNAAVTNGMWRVVTWLLSLGRMPGGGQIL